MAGVIANVAGGKATSNICWLMLLPIVADGSHLMIKVKWQMLLPRWQVV